MKNINPFVPQGSVLEQNKRRSRMKLAVFCVLAVSVAGLSAMLIQGCKREQVSEEGQNQPPVETNTVAMDTNPPPTVASNPPVVAPAPPPVPEVAGTEYVVIKGDSFAKIAKKFGVSIKAIQGANPGVEPTKLKVGQKLTVPGGGTTPAATAASETGTGGGETYVVKSGDSLTKIAKAHGTTVKAIKAENNLNTDHIKVGQKLKIPAKAESTAPVPLAPASLPPPAPTPVPAGTPAGQ
jgi:LysM repeat protein